MILLVGLGILLSQCQTVKAPRGTVPKRKQISTTAFGGWMTLSFLDTARQTIEGEFIAVDNDTIYMLLREGIDARATADVRSARIILFETEASAFGVWTTLSTLLTISNGGFLIFTAPLTIATGIATTVGESKRINYVEFPTHDWTELRKYARFPQGIPEAITLQELKPSPTAPTLPTPPPQTTANER